MSDYTLKYPCDIAEEIGLSTNEINSMKHKGCRFYGRKTSVRWVRDWLDEQTRLLEESQSALEHRGHLPRSIENIHHAQA